MTSFHPFPCFSAPEFCLVPREKQEKQLGIALHSIEGPPSAIKSAHGDEFCMENWFGGWGNPVDQSEALGMTFLLE